MTAPRGAAALRVMTEPQEGARYEQLVATANAADAAGFDGFFRSDHLMTIAPGPPRDATEAWTTLGALARETRRIRLGTLVSPVTFRHPAVLARMAATVDQLSGGRVELGIGAGWYESEHSGLGIPLPPLAERMARFEEAAVVVRALLDGGPVTHRGTHYQLDGGISLPRPLQEHLPLLTGGRGGPRSVAIAARFADEYNVLLPPGERVAAAAAAVRAASEAAGRPAMRLSWMGPCIVGADTPALRARARAFAGWLGPGEHGSDEVLTAMRPRGLVGLHDEVAQRMHEMRDQGCERFYLQLLDLDDLDVFGEMASVAEQALGAAGAAPPSA